jgi:hypothetical protein
MFCSFFDDVDNWRMAKKLFSHTRCSGKMMIAAGSCTMQCTFHRFKQHMISSLATLAHHQHSFKSAVAWALSTISSISLHLLLLLNLSGTHRRAFQCVQLLELK